MPFREEKEKESLSSVSSGSSNEKSILLKEKEKQDTFNYQTLSEENQTVKETINPRNCCSYITESSLFELCRLFLVCLSLPPVNIYLFKVINRNTRKRSEICSKLTLKTPERHLGPSGVFVVNFEHISDFFLVFLLLTLNR